MEIAIMLSDLLKSAPNAGPGMLASLFAGDAQAQGGSGSFSFLLSQKIASAMAQATGEPVLALPDGGLRLEFDPSAIPPGAVVISPPEAEVNLGITFPDAAAQILETADDAIEETCPEADGRTGPVLEADPELIESADEPEESIGFFPCPHWILHMDFIRQPGDPPAPQNPGMPPALAPPGFPAQEAKMPHPVFEPSWAMDARNPTAHGMTSTEKTAMVFNTADGSLTMEAVPSARGMISTEETAMVFNTVEGSLTMEAAPSARGMTSTEKTAMVFNAVEGSLTMEAAPAGQGETVEMTENSPGIVAAFAPKPDHPRVQLVPASDKTPVLSSEGGPDAVVKVEAAFENSGKPDADGGGVFNPEPDAPDADALEAEPGTEGKVRFVKADVQSVSNSTVRIPAAAEPAVAQASGRGAEMVEMHANENAMHPLAGKKPVNQAEPPVQVPPEPGPPETAEPSVLSRRMEQLAVKSVRLMNLRGEQSMRIRLVPKSLGEMRIELSHSADEVHVRLVSANQAVRDAFEEKVEILRQVLSNDGETEVRVTVASDSGSRGNPGAFENRQGWMEGQRPRAPGFWRSRQGFEHGDKQDARSSGKSIHDGTLSVYI